MTKASLISKIASKLTNQMEGDIIILIDQYIDTALGELEKVILDSKSHLWGYFRESLVNQTWAASAFSAPDDLIRYKQREHVKMSIGVDPVFQVDNFQKLQLLSGETTNHYACFDGDSSSWRIRHKDGTTVTTATLNIVYCRTLDIADVNGEMEHLLVDILLKKILPVVDNGQK